MLVQRILILNAHSGLNLGDDAIMSVTLDSIRRIYPNCSVTIAANDPSNWQRYSDKNVQVLHSLCTWVADCAQGEWRNNAHLMPIVIFQIILSIILYRLFNIKLVFGPVEKKLLLQAYYDSDIILSCGGGNYFANTPISPAYVWALISLGYAIGLNKRTIMLPQSIGPVSGWIQLKLTEIIFKRVDRIMVRERRSASFLKDELSIIDNVSIFPDLAFGLPVNNIYHHPNKGKSREKFHIGITVINRRGQDKSFIHQRMYEDLIIKIIYDIHHLIPTDIFFIIQCSGPSIDQDDRIVTQRIFDTLDKSINASVIGPFATSSEIGSIYKSMDIVIGTRLHSGIFSIINHIPFILIGYQPKAIGVLEMINLQNQCYDINHLNAEEIVNHITLIIRNYSDAVDMIKEGAEIAAELQQGWLSYLSNKRD